jgi:hypothetical protein
VDRKWTDPRVRPLTLHVTNGDAVAPALRDATGEEVVVWRDVLHEGPVPASLGPDELAQVRAKHLAARGWVDEATALAGMRERDARLAAHPPEAEVVLWFEDDLYDALQLAQIDDRLAGRAGPVLRVRLPHDRRGIDLATLPREPHVPTPDAFAALRSPDPRAWIGVPGFERLLEELPDPDTGLGRAEREIVAALRRDGPLTPLRLFVAVAEQEEVPWIGDTIVFALADDLAPLVVRRGERYALAGEPPREVRERWLGGVLLPGWAYKSGSVLRTI